MYKKKSVLSIFCETYSAIWKYNKLAKQLKRRMTMVEKVLKSEKYYVRKSQILGSASKVSHLIHYDLKCFSFSSVFKISR